MSTPICMRDANKMLMAPHVFGGPATRWHNRADRVPGS
jgi:hypothetical protein